MSRTLTNVSINKTTKDNLSSSATILRAQMSSITAAINCQDKQMLEDSQKIFLTAMRKYLKSIKAIKGAM